MDAQDTLHAKTPLIGVQETFVPGQGLYAVYIGKLDHQRFTFMKVM